MSGFSADWLRLREPFDHAAREAAQAQLGPMAAACAPGPLQVVELGCGTGSNLRYLAPRLGGSQHWQVFDHDDALLDAWPEALQAWAGRDGHRVRACGEVLHVEGEGFAARVQRRRLDLATHLHAVPWAGAGLVCAAALIDLVSADWLDRLVAHCNAAGADLLLALSVDGRLDWSPADPADAAVAACFEQHQRRDKGFGPALGPQAPVEAAGRLVAAGYRVQQARSDWVATGALQSALIDGMAQAAEAQAPALRAAVRAWQTRRQALGASSSLRVGHVDILARHGGVTRGR